MAYVTSRDTLVIKIHYAGARRHWDASHYFASFGRLKIWRLRQRPHYTVVITCLVWLTAPHSSIMHVTCSRPGCQVDSDAVRRLRSLMYVRVCGLYNSAHSEHIRHKLQETFSGCDFSPLRIKPVSVRSPSPCHHFTARPSTEHYLLVKCWRIDLLRIQFPGQSLDCVGSGFSL